MNCFGLRSCLYFPGRDVLEPVEHRGDVLEGGVRGADIVCPCVRRDGKAHFAHVAIGAAIGASAAVMAAATNLHAPMAAATALADAALAAC